MKVSIGIITYNQAAYIQQCIDSILMQSVDFEYEIVVGDDASTDGTQMILREYQNKYPNLFILILNESNEGISINYNNVLSKCGGEYVALCEGDDYWTNPLKLQTQVDFLDTHQDYGFVGTYNDLLFPDKTIKNDSYDYLKKTDIEGDWELYGDVFSIAKYGPVTRTVSLCFRKKIIQPYLKYVGVGNDLVLQTILARYSFFAKHSNSMCMYRQGGVSTNKLSIHKQLYYNNWYVQNRLLQKELFPQECRWDTDELKDREIYIRLCDEIRRYKPFRALKYKRQLRSSIYQNKIFSRFLHGPLSCVILTVVYNLKK